MSFLFSIYLDFGWNKLQSYQLLFFVRHDFAKKKKKVFSRMICEEKGNELLLVEE